MFPNTPLVAASMRLDTSKPFITWHAEVPGDILQQFDNLLPIHGARKHVLEVGVQKFLEIVETSPSIAEWCHQQIQDMLLQKGIWSGKKKINLQIATEVYVRFNKIFPEWGATSWFIRHLLMSLIEEMSDGPCLEDQVEAAVRKMIRPKAVTQ